MYDREQRMLAERLREQQERDVQRCNAWEALLSQDNCSEEDLKLGLLNGWSSFCCRLLLCALL